MSKSKVIQSKVTFSDSSDNEDDVLRMKPVVKPMKKAPVGKVTLPDSDLESSSLALFNPSGASSKLAKKSAAKESSGNIKAIQKSMLSEASQTQIIPGFGDIWSKLTNGSKTANREFEGDYGKFKTYIDMMYFVMRHGFHFKKIIDTYRSVLCATIADKDGSMGWNTKLFVIVQHPVTNLCIILQMNDNEKPYKEYSITRDSNLLCSDVLRNEKVLYQMTICSNMKKLITIQFGSLKERTFWRKCLYTGDLED